MTQPTRRQLMAGSFAAVGAAGAPAMAVTQVDTGPSPAKWLRFRRAIQRLTPEQLDDVIAAGRAMLREQGIEP